MIKAVMDIGTNTTRLLVGEVQNGSVRVLSRQVRTTRLGEGISGSSVLKPQAIRRTAEAIAEFAKAAKAMGAAEIYPYATAAAREADNCAEFCALVKQLSGLDVDIVPGEKEALIAYTGAACGRQAAVIDIGGGSAEVIVKQGERLQAKSCKCGCVRLTERFGGQEGLDEALKQQVISFVAPIIESYSSLPLGKTELIGVSGTPTSLAAIQKGMVRYDGAAIQGTKLSLRQINKLTDRLCALTEKERCLVPGLAPERAPLLPFGALYLACFMQRYGYDEITVSDTDSLEGYLLLKESAQ